MVMRLRRRSTPFPLFGRNHTGIAACNPTLSLFPFPYYNQDISLTFHLPYNLRNFVTLLRLVVLFHTVYWQNGNIDVCPITYIDYIVADICRCLTSTPLYMLLGRYQILFQYLRTLKR